MVKKNKTITIGKQTLASSLICSFVICRWLCCLEVTIINQMAHENLKTARAKEHTPTKSWMQQNTTQPSAWVTFFKKLCNLFLIPESDAQIFK